MSVTTKQSVFILKLFILIITLLFYNVLYINKSLLNSHKIITRFIKFNDILISELLINELKFINTILLLNTKYFDVNHSKIINVKSSKRCIINYIVFVLIICGNAFN